MSEIKYTSLGSHDIVRPGDEFLLGSEWRNHSERCYGHRVGHNTSRRPIRTTSPAAYEEVPGSRTSQQAVEQPQRERIAYEELQPGDIIQEGDEHRNADGRWHAYDASLCGSLVYGAWGGRARRPHNITALEKYRGDLIGDIEHVIGERDEARRERDLARSEVARLSTELWARKPLEERITSLVDELANAREDFQKLVKTNAENADQFAEHTATLVQERDEARAERDKLKGLIDDLLDEPTAKQVQQMLRTWATELDWSAGCFDSVGREQIDTIQKTLIAVIERIEGMINPEGGSDDN